MSFAAAGAPAGAWRHEVGAPTAATAPKRPYWLWLMDTAARDDFYLKMRADSSKNFLPNHQCDLSVLAVAALLAAETTQTSSARVRLFP